jgi:hypothetical protein
MDQIDHPRRLSSTEHCWYAWGLNLVLFTEHEFLASKFLPEQLLGARVGSRVLRGIFGGVLHLLLVD